MSKGKRKLFKSVDTISREMDAIDKFVLNYWKKYVYAAIVLVVIVAVAFISFEVYESNSSASVRELVNATTTEQLQNVIALNPSNALTPYIELELVSKLIRKNDIDGAKKICDSLSSLSYDNYAILRARIDLGYIAEIKGEKDEAIKQFTSISSDAFAPEHFKAESFYNLGRIYLEIGKKDRALDMLKKCSVINSSLSTGWQEFATNLMNRIN